MLSHFADLTMEKTLELVRAEEARRVKEFEAQHGTRAATEAEIERLGTELRRLARAVAAGGEIEELVTLMQQTQKRRDALTAKLADFSAGQSPEELEKCVIAVWKEFSAAFEWPPHGPRARQALRLILREPITITPVVTNGYLREWEYLGMGLLDRALAGRMRPSVTNAYATELVPPG
ncbi:MAG TPA: hypothetical protein VFS98_01480 [Methylomirabilota bacterium]|nr:hypothetical protein [Methylomirabilota bacterium]